MKGVIEYRYTVNGRQRNSTFRYNGFISFVKGMIKAHLKGSETILNHKGK